MRSVDGPKKKIEKATKEMKIIAEKVEERNRTQTKTPKQLANWIDWDKILDLFKSISKDIRNRRLWAKEHISKHDRRQLENVLILGFHGVFLPPGRLEAASLVFVNRGSKSKPNTIYKDKGGFVMEISQSKTTKFHGKLVQRLPIQLARILKKYINRFEISPGENIFQTSTGRPYTRKMYSRRVQSIFHEAFNKNIGVSLLRSIYLSDFHKNTPSLQKMLSTAKTMQHTIKTSLENYVKK